jgi:hypothetical protein
MSGRKYVPSFLRNQGANGGSGANSGAGTNVNRFAAFDDEYEAPKAVAAPAPAPATLASLTSDSKPTGRSYAARFSDKARRDDKPAVPAAPKTDLSSETQFPALGGAAKKPSGAWGKPTATSKPAATGSGGEKLSTLAKEWAKKKEEEEAAAEALRIAEEKKRYEEEMLALALKNSIRRGVSGFENPDYSEEDYFHNPYAAQELLADEDSVELPSEEEPTDDDFDEDEYDENGEHNSNIAYDGRRKDDLY